MSAFETFQNVVSHRHDYARQWKTRTGRKVFGYLCTYVPEEIIYAAGLLPVRVLGSHTPKLLSERHILGMYCLFCRDVLSEGLSGRYDYLDGIVYAHSCIHMRQAFLSWQLHVPVSYKHYVFVPHQVGARLAPKLLTAELGRFKTSLEEWAGRPITDQSLDKAVATYNTNRRLMREMYELRKSSPPLVSGHEAAVMVLASQFMDKEEHNELLRQVISTRSELRSEREPGVRLMMIGSEMDDVRLIALIESLGADVVTDDHCTGTRYFWNEVSPNQDRLAGIANRYLDKPRCPHKDIAERSRLTHIEQLANQYKVEGVVLVQQKFCDIHSLDIPAIKRSLEAKNIPTIHIEMDSTFSPSQLRTRIEAFLEMFQLSALT